MAGEGLRSWTRRVFGGRGGKGGPGIESSGDGKAEDTGVRDKEGPWYRG